MNPGPFGPDFSFVVDLDLTADSGAIAWMSHEAADALGWTLNGSSIEAGEDDGLCYCVFGLPWDDDESDAANDAQADYDKAVAKHEITAAGLRWQEV